MWLQEQSLNVVVRTGHTSLLLRDALRRPLLEVELGEVESGLRRLSGSVLQVACSACSAFVGYHPDRGWAATALLHRGLINTLPCPQCKPLFLPLNFAICAGKGWPLPEARAAWGFSADTFVLYSSCC